MERNTVILVFFFVVYFVGDTNQHPQHNVGIVDGKIIRIEDASYMVSLKYKGIHVCGGSIIERHFILTAESCFKQKDKSILKKYKVVVGTDNIAHGGKEYEIDDYFFHPNLSEAFDDIAIIRLTKHLTFGTKVGMAYLPRYGQDVEEETQVNVTGWGSSMINRSNSVKLRQVTVPVISRWECGPTEKGELDDYEFCYGARGKGTCEGDAGGPVTANGVQVGIISRRTEHSCSGKPRIATKVAMYVSWINKIRYYHV